MSDTLFFGKSVSKKTKAMLLYAGTSACIVAGGAMVSMKPEEWANMSWMQQSGWTILLVGNVLNTIKAYYSASSKEQPSTP